MKSVTVFAGANPGVDAHYLETAFAFGRLLAQSNMTLIYGGGGAGLMGALADGVLQEGGEVFGVMPKFLVEREIAHRGLTELVVVESMHQRKAAMSSRSDAFIAMPGGAGTLEEIFEVWSWSQIGLLPKPTALFNVGGFFDPLVTFLEHATREGFVNAPNMSALIVESDPVRLVARLRHAPPPPDRWQVST